MGNLPVGSGSRPSRRLEWPDCRNARDLGGLPLRGGHTRWGVLVRSDSTANLTPAGAAAMRDHGIATIVDLRTASEVARSPYRGDRAGPVYRHLPLVEDEMTAQLDQARGMLERYLMILDVGRAHMRPIFETFAEADAGLLFHCFAGKDRTGIVAAMVLALAGVSDGAIAHDFAETDDQLAGRYEEWLASAPPERRQAMSEDLRCPPERILGVLEHLRARWGGVGSYLRSTGVGQATLEAIQARLA